MSEINNDKDSRSKSYFRYLILILILVQILDSYGTVFPGAIPSLIAVEFLSAYETNVVNSIMAIAGAITSIGMYFLFFSQYLADKIGRKRMLAISVFGMAFATLGMFISYNYFIYVFFTFFLGFFVSSDIWLIYVNEETTAQKRALFSNLILMAGLLGPIFMVISRSIFITGTISNWRGMTIIPMIIGFPLCLIIIFTLKETSGYQLIKEGAIQVEKRSFKEDIISIFKTEDRKPYTALLVMVFIRGGSSIYMNLFEKYITDVGTLTQDQVTIIFFLTIFTVLIAYGTNGFLADRIGRKPLLYLWSCLTPVSVIMWVMGALHPQSAFLIVMIGFALSHICFWGSLGILRLITIELLPTDRRGTGVGFRSLIGSLGYTVGLFLSSIVILFLGLGTTFMIFVFGNLLLIPIAYFFVKETKGVELSEIK